MNIVVVVLVVVLVVVVDVDVLVEVDVVVEVVVGLQHKYACVSTQLPTLGLILLRIRLPAIKRPVPS